MEMPHTLRILTQQLQQWQKWGHVVKVDITKVLDSVPYELVQTAFGYHQIPKQIIRQFMRLISTRSCHVEFAQQRGQENRFGNGLV